MQLVFLRVFFGHRSSRKLLTTLINTIAIVQGRVCSGSRKKLHDTYKQAKTFLPQKAICEKATTESLSRQQTIRSNRQSRSSTWSRDVLRKPYNNKRFGIASHTEVHPAVCFLLLFRHYYSLGKDSDYFAFLEFDARVRSVSNY